MNKKEFLSTAIGSLLVDFGKQSSNYALHRPGFPASFYSKLSSYIDVKGKRVLDVGSGPGVIALELARRGAIVHGSDVSVNQVEAAKQLAEQQGLTDKCTFSVATAEETNQLNDAYDLVTAGTCWHWFNKPKACTELLRILKPGGLFIVAQYVYLPEPDSLAGETEQIILKYNPKWPMAGSNGCNPEYIQELKSGGFEFIEQFCFDHQQSFTHQGWLGRIQTCNGVGAGILSQEEVNKFSDELMQLMKDKYPVDLLITHRVFSVVVRKPVS